MKNENVNNHPVHLPRSVAHLVAALLAQPVARYISRARDRLLPSALPLSSHDKQPLRAYFDNLDLDRARVVLRDPLPIPDPPFFAQARRLGLDFLRPAEAAAITLDHVVASRIFIDQALLFHELVHVVQFRLLGLSSFARLYTRGFLVTGSYHRIPLEQCAFELTFRFESGEPPFAVTDEIRSWIDRGLF